MWYRHKLQTCLIQVLLELQRSEERRVQEQEYTTFSHLACRTLDPSSLTRRGTSQSDLWPAIWIFSSYTLDNEAPYAFVHYLQDENIDFQLAPPSFHWRNAAERTIWTFNNHLSPLCVTLTQTSILPYGTNSYYRKLSRSTSSASQT